MHDVHIAASAHNIVMLVLCTQCTLLYYAHGGAGARDLCEEKNKINNKPFLNRRGLLSKPYDRHRPKHRA